MAAQNFKGELQEWTQKQGLPKPKYHTVRLEDSEDHCPNFQSTVSFLIHHDQQQPSQFTGDFVLSKKKAEANVAEIALQGLHTYKQQQTIHISPSKPIYVLCDLENISIKMFLDQHQFQGPVYFYGFCANDHPSAQNPLDEKYPIITQIIHSTRRDACDVSIIMFATRLMLVIPRNAILLIVTRDRFGAALADCVNSNFLQLNVPVEFANRAIHVTNLQDLLQSLNVFQEN